MCQKDVNGNGIVIASLSQNYYPILMRKIKQSFVEVVAGQPRKEHYVKVSIVILLISVAVGAFLIVINKG